MFLVTATIYGTTVYGFIILSGHMAEQFDWTKAQAGSLVSAMWLIAPIALCCAPLIKRVGAWNLLAGGLAIDAAALWASASADAFWQVLALRVAMGVGKILAIACVPVIVAQWFSARFGTAIAIAWCGGSFGGLVLAPVTEQAVDRFDWRWATQSLAGLVLAVALIVFVAAKLTHAAARAPHSHVAAHDLPTEERQSSETRQRSGLGSIGWATASCMVLAVACSGIGGLALTVSMPAILESGGFSSTFAAALLGVVAAGAMGGQLASGWMLDRRRSYWTSFSVVLGMLIGLSLFGLLGPTGSGNAHAVLAALAFGAAAGGCEVLWITLTKRQFGTELFPLTYGGWCVAYQLGCAMGGGIGGVIYDRFDQSVLLIAVGLFFVPAAVLSIWRPNAINEHQAEMVRAIR
jgi:predicted MFS family arabinose efflux permease